MMGRQNAEQSLFSYRINLDQRVRADHPLRQVAAAIDFGFAREEVAGCYGRNGNPSVDPEVILKMMFLLFFEDIKRVRQHFLTHPPAAERLGKPGVTCR